MTKTYEASIVHNAEQNENATDEKFALKPGYKRLHFDGTFNNRTPTEGRVCNADTDQTHTSQEPDSSKINLVISLPGWSRGVGI